MKTYRVFADSFGRRQVVKQGWSWPAFFLPHVWALRFRLWSFAAAFLIPEVLISVVSSTTDIPSDVATLLVFAELAARIVYGGQGNSWREVSLISKGYVESSTFTQDHWPMFQLPILKSRPTDPRLLAFWKDPVWSVLIATGMLAILAAAVNYVRVDDSAGQLVAEQNYTRHCTMVTISGTVIPNGVTTDAWFEWGPTPDVDRSTRKQTFSERSEYFQHLDGLTENTRYYYRSVVENADGKDVGHVRIFVTPKC